MKYNININQIKAIEWKLTFAESVLVDLFAHLPTWAESKIIGDEVRYFFSKNKILEQVPILSEKGNIDTIYRQTKKLVKKGVIDFKKVGVKDYWKLNPVMRDWIFNSDSNPTQLGFSSESNSDSRPTNNNINNNNINNTSVAKANPTKVNASHYTDYATDAEEIYELYCKNKPIGRRYRKKLAIERIIKVLKLKEYNKDKLIQIVNTYKSELSDIKYTKNPEYFFATNTNTDNSWFFTAYEGAEVKKKVNTNTDELYKYI